MVVRVEQELRTRLIQTVLAVARQDVDGVINGFMRWGSSIPTWTGERYRTPPATS